MPLPGEQIPARPTDLMRRVEKLERLVQRLSAGRSLENATINNVPGKGIRSSDFNGTSFANPGTKGVYVGGDGIVAHVGAIFNDALANPVVPGSVNQTTKNFSLTAAFAEVVGLDLPVPSGCTRALVNLTVWMQGYNSHTTGGSNGSGADYLYAYVNIAGSTGEYNAQGVSGSGGTATTGGGFGLYLTGLTPGGTLHVGGWGSSQYQTLAASTYNKATLTGTVSWLR